MAATLACHPSVPASPSTVQGGAFAAMAQAQAFAQRIIVIDGHISLPWRQDSMHADDAAMGSIADATVDGAFDYQRALRGGLDAAWMAAFVPPGLSVPAAERVADRQLQHLEQLAANFPTRFAIAHAPREITEHVQTGVFAVVLSLENADPIGTDLSRVPLYRTRGVASITLTHAQDNAYADAAGDRRGTHGGLTELGRRVIKAMNRSGIVLDVTHLAESAVVQALEVSEAPVMASHVACRALTPDQPDNLSDAIIQGIAARGGVVMITFGSAFLDDAVYAKHTERWDRIRTALQERGATFGDALSFRLIQDIDRAYPPARASIDKVVDHIMHVVELAGPQAVGFGSDFEGVGDTLPLGLPDVSAYPELFVRLRARGLNDAALTQIAGGNVMRVWQTALDYAAAMPD